ncbi:Uma2 family endonuclease [Streptomyces piniterrae]|uniref:Uma2 family endonuclease n=1 Tax=Streptomyces piniterrae TaxID=2571125 RepID=A0A4U0N6N4_9ACTN|nr:Uma2 family endonuclease [Streptomyces piniterrae]TJZ45334.1 Uma2 family endonuclease [Streptomyces piniterrae]
MPARKPTLLDQVDWLMDRVPGARFEVIGGEICVTPLPDGPHQSVLTDLTLLFMDAGLDNESTEVLQKVAVWLPGGPSDFAIPDLSVIEPFDDHMIEFNCYDPAIFRLVLEVTANNYGNELRSKVAAYAQAKIPVYVILNRRDDRIHVLTDPSGDAYGDHRVHSPGERITLPESIGAKVTLDVKALLDAARN